MADTETKTISLALYRYMCQNIVGSENHVKNLRLMNTVRDNMTRKLFITVITSGSFGEGLEMRGSDLDVMYVNKKIEVYENVQTSLNSNVLYLSMETDDVKAGFAQLQVKQNYSQSLVEYFEEHNGKHYFSSTLYKQVLDCNSNNTHKQKPSLALCRYMCQNIVGSDKHVKTMRLINTVRDNLNSNECQTTITSGSFGERLELRGSYLDMMQVAKLVGVYEYGEKRLNPNKVYYRMETDDVHPGFAHLLVQNSGYKDETQIFKELNGKHYISTTLFIRHHLTDGYGGIIHGLSDINLLEFAIHSIFIMENLHMEAKVFHKANLWLKE
ncbi:unnamed protein product [Mytilus edulis]|uniref:Uncharacterized protein n=1 Tax=Mytilus edulis TaxID=6550 RepID=A0A8S3RW87_MYTED|nr:unnamed protein product [Mytilus edulis]